MANIAPANFAYVNANGDKGDVQVLSDADITLINEGLQDIEDLKLAIQKPLPAGTIVSFAGNVVPEGFLICNGAAVSRTTYASLFAVIGTLYGTGDGSTTFALPDYRGRVLQGADDSHAAGTYIPAGLPNISGRSLGYILTDNVRFGGVNGPYLMQSTEQIFGKITFTRQSSPYCEVGAEEFSAARANSIYGGSSTIQPSASAVQYLIKY